MLGNEFCLQSPNFLIMAFTPHAQNYFHDYSFNKATDTYENDREVLKRLNAIPDFRQTINARKPSVMFLDGFTSYTRNIFLDGEHIARFVMALDHPDPTPGYLMLVEEFVGYLGFALSTYALPDSTADLKPLKTCLSSIIEGSSVDRGSAGANLRSCGWNLDDQLLCAVVPFSQSGNPEYPIEIARRKAVSVLGFGCCVIFEHAGLLTYVIDLDLCGTDISGVKAFLASEHSEAGVGRTAQSAFELRPAFTQARIALEESPSQGGADVRTFDECALSYLFDNSLRELSIMQIAPAGIALLVDHDRQHRSAYAKTLLAFLRNESNTVKTARGLGIHRSTLLYRLERVREITGCDFTRPEDRLHYEWCLTLLERKKRR